jgi:hypothetical protein
MRPPRTSAARRAHIRRCTCAKTCPLEPRKRPRCDRRLTPRLQRQAAQAGSESRRTSETGTSLGQGHVPPSGPPRRASAHRQLRCLRATDPPMPQPPQFARLLLRRVSHSRRRLPANARLRQHPRARGRRAPRAAARQGLAAPVARADHSRATLAGAPSARVFSAVDAFSTFRGRLDWVTSAGESSVARAISIRFQPPEQLRDVLGRTAPRPRHQRAAEVVHGALDSFMVRPHAEHSLPLAALRSRRWRSFRSPRPREQARGRQACAEDPVRQSGVGRASGVSGA